MPPRTLFTFTVKVTTPYKREDEIVVVKDHKESLKEQIEYLIKTELSYLQITGLNISVK